MKRNRPVLVENNECLVHCFHDFEFVKTDGAVVFGFDDWLLERLARSTADVEGSHRELGAGFADGLRGNDAHSFTDLDHAACGKTATVAFDTNTALGFASKCRTDLELLVADFLQRSCSFLINELIFFKNGLACDRIFNGFAAGAADDTGREADHFFVSFIDRADDNAICSMAVIDRDDDILRGVDEFTCKISRVSSFESCISETFAGAVSGDEILEHGQSLTEVRGDGLLDDFARWFGHLTTHTGELLNLGAVTTRTGIHHHKDGVHVAAVVVVFKRAEEGVGDLFTGVGPDILNFVFALAIGDDASAVLFFHLSDFTVGFFEELLFLLGHHHVVDTDGNTRAGCFAEAEFLETVKRFDGGLLTT